MCSKDCKQFGIASASAVALKFVLDFLTHAVALMRVYEHPGYAALWNSQAVMRARMPANFLAILFFGPLFTKIYTIGYEEPKPALGQGLRYGLWMGLLMGSQAALMQYYVYPVSWKLAAAWFAADIVEFTVIGAAVASIYHPHHEAP